MAEQSGPVCRQCRWVRRWSQGGSATRPSVQRFSCFWNCFGNQILTCRALRLAQGRCRCTNSSNSVCLGEKLSQEAGFHLHLPCGPGRSHLGGEVGTGARGAGEVVGGQGPLPGGWGTWEPPPQLHQSLPAPLPFHSFPPSTPPKSGPPFC